MSRARSLRSVLALLTIVGWANAQAMACCRAPDASPSTAASADAGSRDMTEPDASEPMAADHSCCPGGAPAGSQTTSTSDASEPDASREASSACGGTSGVASPCCETVSEAVVSAASASSGCPAGTLLLTEHCLQVAPAADTPPFLRLSSFSSDGSPPYLALRRLLI